MCFYLLMHTECNMNINDNHGLSFLQASSCNLNLIYTVYANLSLTQDIINTVFPPNSMWEFPRKNSCSQKCHQNFRPLLSQPSVTPQVVRVNSSSLWYLMRLKEGSAIICRHITSFSIFICLIMCCFLGGSSSLDNHCWSVQIILHSDVSPICGTRDSSALYH